MLCHCDKFTELSLEINKVSYKTLLPRVDTYSFPVLSREVTALASDRRKFRMTCPLSFGPLGQTTTDFFSTKLGLILLDEVFARNSAKAGSHRFILPT
jgi:hypothetical protein